MKKLLSTVFAFLFFTLTSIASAEPVDINSADAHTIASNTKGIGLVKATAIVNFREKNGVFRSIEDLQQVKGIGIKTIEKNRANLLVATEAVN